MDEFSKLLNKIERYNPHVDKELIKRALRFAAVAHAGQHRRSGKPFIYHGIQTAGILADLHLDSVMIACGILHDVVEDTSVTLDKVRKEFGLKNLKVMIPMCRTVEEGKKAIRTMAEHGLKQHQDKLEVYVMCEVPSNVILADDFAKIFDGFSIGSNDLTQLTLGIDRDSELVSHVFDERDPAVLKMIEQVIRVAKKHKKKIGICGDAPSTHHEIVKFLVKRGIDSMSLSPDAIMKVRMEVAKLEKK